jgi:hypothetical protein
MMKFGNSYDLLLGQMNSMPTLVGFDVTSIDGVGPTEARLITKHSCPSSILQASFYRGKIRKRVLMQFLLLSTVSVFDRLLR